MLHIINPDIVDSGHYFADQVVWAQADLTAHQNSLLRFLFLHIIRQPNATGSTLTEWKPAWIDGLHTNMVHYGHNGESFVEVSGNTPVHWIETKDMIGGRYRLVRIDHGVIGPYTYNGDSKSGIPSGNLELSFSPANNGQHNTLTATINNRLLEHFEHARLRFVVPKYGCYQTNRGVVNQLVHSDDGRITVAYVTVDIPVNSQIQVKLTPCNNSDLALTQSVSAPSVIPGGNLTYTLTVTNKGPTIATGVTLTNTLAASVTLTSTTSGNCAQLAGKIVTCPLGNLAYNSSAQVSLQVVVNLTATGILTNLATVAANEPDPITANNTIQQEVTLVSPSPSPPIHQFYLPILLKQ
ncbi:MAG: DUF11 domain-containing protein [Chloroflexi bacterium]|nr:DUF11 domain-containing protein [Chloroflexota bacterium]